MPKTEAYRGASVANAFSGLDSRDKAELRRKAIILSLAIWAFHTVLTIVIATVLDSAFDPACLSCLAQPITLYRIGSGSLGLLICIAIYFLLERLQDRPFWQQILATFAFGLPAGIFYLFVERWSLATLSSGRIVTRLPEISPNIYYNRALFWVFFFLAWAISIHALMYSLKAAREQRHRAAAQALAHQAQIAALRYQLNPHFLFNTLNSIAALVVDGRSDAAEQMLLRLSTFLRAGLVTDPLDDIPLESEIEQQRIYLEIERVRFPDRLNFEVDVPPELHDVLVPSLILQPLVENAVRYGVASSAQRTTVRIQAGKENGMMSLSVLDDGRGEAKAGGSGVGLANVEQRLRARFGDSVTFEAGRLDPNGFRVSMKLPLLRVGLE